MLSIDKFYKLSIAFALAIVLSPGGHCLAASFTLDKITVLQKPLILRSDEPLDRVKKLPFGDALLAVAIYDQSKTWVEAMSGYSPDLRRRMEADKQTKKTWEEVHSRSKSTLIVNVYWAFVEFHDKHGKALVAQGQFLADDPEEVVKDPNYFAECDPDQSPGPEGQTIRYYQECWRQIGGKWLLVWPLDFEVISQVLPTTKRSDLSNVLTALAARDR